MIILKPEVVSNHSVKEIFFSAFLQARRDGKPEPTMAEMKAILIEEGLGSMQAVQNIGKHYPFFKGRWHDVIAYGAMVYPQAVKAVQAVKVKKKK